MITNLYIYISKPFCMNKLTPFLIVVLIIGIYAIKGNAVQDVAMNTLRLQQVYKYKKLNVSGCAADYNEPTANDQTAIPLLNGWGTHTMKISTQNDSAFLYFNQGINMFYGFHFIEARASFKKAQQFDSACAVSYLGEALTYGPNINNSLYKLRPYVLTLMEKAQRFAPAAGPVEKALIAAQSIRYNTDTSAGFDK